MIRDAPGVEHIVLSKCAKARRGSRSGSEQNFGDMSYDTQTLSLRSRGELWLMSPETLNEPEVAHRNYAKVWKWI
jgi:hypothetical protein